MKQNMGTADKIIRILLAAVIVGLWYYEVIGGILATVLLAFSGIFILTSVIGVCPLYLPFRINTRKGEKTADFASLVNQGAIIVDVRSATEFGLGHIQRAINIPLDDLTSKLNLLPGKEQPIILCCASGIRSERALNKLKMHGFSRVYDGGSWLQLKTQLS